MSALEKLGVKGRTSYPLLFDRQGQPQPAFDAVIQGALSAQREELAVRIWNSD
jgi:hypothetical protein